MVFVDSGAWYALFVADDPHFGSVNDWFDENEDLLITTDYCVDETLTLLVARVRPDLALDAGRAFFNEEFAELHFLVPNQIRRAWLLFQTRIGAGWSFTDCTSHVLISELRIATALTLDAHFRQFGNVEVIP